eukprot:1257219-Amphidinium_carterae.1
MYPTRQAKTACRACWTLPSWLKFGLFATRSDADTPCIRTHRMQMRHCLQLTTNKLTNINSGAKTRQSLIA